jgi:AmmeMemoRadiSam system protein A
MELGYGFDEEEKSVLLKIARKAVEAAVDGKSYYPDPPRQSKLLRNAGAFVTLRKKGELRGCIGYIEPRLPLYETVAQTGAKAAISDPRFESVTKDELNDIEIEISVLSPLKRIQNVDEIVVGKHGVMIERGYYRGLLLPQVATENNWDRNTFLEFTCMKAGLAGDCYKKGDVSIYIFTAEVFSESEQRTKSEENIIEGI